MNNYMPPFVWMQLVIQSLILILVYLISGSKRGHWKHVQVIKVYSFPQGSRTAKLALPSTRRLLALNGAEWHFNLGGIIAAGVRGLVIPALTFLFGIELLVINRVHPLLILWNWCNNWLAQVHRFHYLLWYFKWQYQYTRRREYTYYT